MPIITNFTKEKQIVTLTLENGKNYKIDLADNSIIGQKGTKLVSNPFGKCELAENVVPCPNLIINWLRCGGFFYGDTLSKGEALLSYLDVLPNYYGCRYRTNQDGTPYIPKGYIKWLRDRHKVFGNDTLFEFEVEQKQKNLNFASNRQKQFYNFVMTKSASWNVNNINCFSNWLVNLKENAGTNLTFTKLYQIVENSIAHYQFDFYNFLTNPQIWEFRDSLDITKTIEENEKIVKALVEAKNEKEFAKKYETLKSLEGQTFGKDNQYTVVLPKCPNDLVREGQRQHNCVASYINAVVNDDCLIYFVRKTDNPDKNYITAEWRSAKKQDCFYPKKSYTSQIKIKNNRYASNEEQNMIYNEIDPIINKLMNEM